METQTTDLYFFVFSVESSVFFLCITEWLLYEYMGYVKYWKID